MRLAGRANWWAPRPLRRLHLRYGIWEAEPLDIVDVTGRGPAPAEEPAAPLPSA
jgi:RND superfamily putative drug exporter